jgi:omega-6 fatty acid desaturase (delta-12 desaturase)
MSDGQPGAPAPLDPRALLREIAAYARPATGRSLFELAVTAVPFLLLLVGMWAALSAGYWISLLLVLPAGAMLVRLFMIQHDCGHGSFFRRRAWNDWVGRGISLLTFTPYGYFRRSHALHHATTGNLDRRGMGDVATLTLNEYRALPRSRRILYRIYRHPLVLFGIAPAFLFLIQFRLPLGLARAGWKPWASTMVTNLALAAVVGLAISLIGWSSFLLIYLPVLLIAATAGVWLFYVQHQFEGATWNREDAWSFHHAALHGSSYYKLPGVLRWLTANIGIHHVHHLSSRIPFYRLGKVLRDRPELKQVSGMTIRESLRSVRLKLWDEEKGGLVSFRDVGRLRKAPSTR